MPHHTYGYKSELDDAMFCTKEECVDHEIMEAVRAILAHTNVTSHERGMLVEALKEGEGALWDAIHYLHRRAYEIRPARKDIAACVSVEDATRDMPTDEAA